MFPKEVPKPTRLTDVIMHGANHAAGDTRAMQSHLDPRITAPGRGPAPCTLGNKPAVDERLGSPAIEREMKYPFPTMGLIVGKTPSWVLLKHLPGARELLANLGEYGGGQLWRRKLRRKSWEATIGQKTFKSDRFGLGHSAPQLFEFPVDPLEVRLHRGDELVGIGAKPRRVTLLVNGEANTTVEQ